MNADASPSLHQKVTSVMKCVFNNHADLDMDVEKGDKLQAKASETGQEAVASYGHTTCSSQPGETPIDDELLAPFDLSLEQLKAKPRAGLEDGLEDELEGELEDGLEDGLEAKPAALADRALEEILRLSEDTAAENCVFLLWGHPDPVRRLVQGTVVKLANPNASYAAFAEIRKQYYSSRGPWRRFLSLRDVSRVVPVPFNFVRPNPTGFLASLVSFEIGQYDKENEQDCRYPKSQDVRNRCIPSKEPGGFLHCEACVEAVLDWGDPEDEDAWRCPGVKFCERESARRNIRTLHYLTICFKDIDAAIYHDALADLGDVELIHNFRNIRAPNYGNKTQRLRHIDRHGLRIEETWQMDRLCLFAVLLTVTVVACGKLVWGSWEVVFGAGSFFIAIPMLILSVLSYRN